MTAITKILHRTIAAVKSAAFSFKLLFAGNSEARCQMQFVRHLQYLISNIFACLTDNDYQEALYSYERRIHKEKVNCLSWLTGLQKYRTTERENACFSLLIDLGQIRRRITDHSTFGLCRAELFELELAIIFFAGALMFSDMAEAAARLNRCTDQFEDCFNHVLNVAAREPVIFILFIGALRELEKLALWERNND